MEQFGKIIGDFFLALALAFSLAAFGIMVFSTVIAGLAMGMHIGGSKVAETAKGWLFNIIGCAAFTGAAALIIKGIQAKFVGP